MRSRTCNKWIVKSTECWFFPRTKLYQILSKTGCLNLSPWRQPKPLTMQSMRYGGVVGVVASPVPEISSISTCKDFLARKSSKRNPKHNTNYLIKLHLWHLTCRDWKLQNVHQNFVYISCLLISYIKIFQKKLGEKWSNNKFESHQTKHLRFFVTNFSEFHSSQLLLPAGAGWVGSFFCFCRRASKTLRALSARLRSVSGVPRVVEIFGEFMRYTDALETNLQLGSLWKIFEGTFLIFGPFSELCCYFQGV